MKVSEIFSSSIHLSSRPNAIADIRAFYVVKLKDCFTEYISKTGYVIKVSTFHFKFETICHETFWLRIKFENDI